MPPVEFEHKISTGEQPKSYVLDRVATGTGSPYYKRVSYPNIGTIQWYVG